MAVGVWARGLGWGRSGRIRLRIQRQWGAVARTSCGATRACGSAARKGRLAGGVGNVGTVSARKGRVQECRRRRSQLLASERAEGLLLGLGETQSRRIRKFPRVRKFKVSSRAYTRVPVATWLATGGWKRRRRESAGVGIGERRDGRCWHRRAEGRCCPTSAGVRRRPEPSLRHGCAIRNRSGPGRTPALSPPAGQLAPRAGGQERIARRDRAARHVSYIGLEPLPRGTTTCPGGWRRKLAKACTARGGGAGAVLGRHGGG